MFRQDDKVVDPLGAHPFDHEEEAPWEWLLLQNKGLIKFPN